MFKHFLLLLATILSLAASQQVDDIYDRGYYSPASGVQADYLDNDNRYNNNLMRMRSRQYYAPSRLNDFSFDVRVPISSSYGHLSNGQHYQLNDPREHHQQQMYNEYRK